MPFTAVVPGRVVRPRPAPRIRRADRAEFAAVIFTGVARALLPLNSAGAHNVYDLVGTRFPTASGGAFPIFAAGCVTGRRTRRKRESREASGNRKILACFHMPVENAAAGSRRVAQAGSRKPCSTSSLI